MPRGHLVEYPSVTLLTKSASCTHSEIGPTLGRLFGGIGAANPGLVQMGAPRAYYLEWNPENCTLQGAIPVGSDVSAGEGSERIEYPAGRALKVSYLGPYDGLAQAWSDAWEQVRTDGFTPVESGLCWDDYVTDPGSEPDPAKWQTDIYIAVK